MQQKPYGLLAAAAILFSITLQPLTIDAKSPVRGGIEDNSARVDRSGPAVVAPTLPPSTNLIVPPGQTIGPDFTPTLRNSEPISEAMPVVGGREETVLINAPIMANEHNGDDPCPDAPELDCNPADLGHFNITLCSVVESEDATEATFTWRICQTQSGGGEFPGLSHWNLELDNAVQLLCIGHSFAPKDLIKAVHIGDEEILECQEDDDLPCWSYGKDGSIESEADWFKFDNVSFSGCETFSITFDLTRLASAEEPGMRYTLRAGCVEGAVKAGQQEHYGQVGGPICVLVPDETPNGEVVCETAYAYSDDEDLATCFLEFADLKAKNWGWSLGPLGASAETYVFELVAGAGRCNVEAGEIVGTLEVDYDGSTATVTYTVFFGNTLEEAHLYVGSTPLHMVTVGRPGSNPVPTTAPGQFPHNADDLDEDNRDETSATFVIEDLEGDIYVVAHSVVCFEVEED